jgi:hypothetical protein
MSYELQITGDDGRLWISPDFVPLNFQRKIAFSGNGSYDTGVSASNRMMFFVRNSAAFIAADFTLSQSGTWIINVSSANGGGTFYIFADIATIKSTYGIAVYSAAGKLLWCTDMLPLMLRRINNPQAITNTNYTVETGVNLAVYPGIVSTYRQVLNPGQNIYIYGFMGCGAYGTSVTVGQMYTEQLSGGTPEPARFKQEFLYIDVSLYD